MNNGGRSIHSLQAVDNGELRGTFLHKTPHRQNATMARRIHACVATYSIATTCIINSPIVASMLSSISCRSVYVRLSIYASDSF